jgi:hypothetical protein
MTKILPGASVLSCSIRSATAGTVDDDSTKMMSLSALASD